MGSRPAALRRMQAGRVLPAHAPRGEVRRRDPARRPAGAAFVGLAVARQAARDLRRALFRAAAAPPDPKFARDKDHEVEHDNDARVWFRREIR